MTCRLSALLLLLLGQIGCTVTAVSERDDPRPSNSCTNDSDCQGVKNAHCSEGLCQTLNGALEALLVAVTPASDSPVSHLTFVTNVEDVPTSGGHKDLVLPGPSSVTGSLQLPEGAPCYPIFASDDPDHPLFKAPDGVSLPAAVTFFLHQGLLGLPQQVYSATTGDGTVLKKGGYSFDLRMPGGEYDVYLVPPPHQLDCRIPPQLIRNRVIKAGALDMPFLVSPISTLSLVLHVPKATNLSDWTADIIEPITGHPISTEVVLSAPAETAGASAAYGVELNYSPVAQPESSQGAVESANDLFRLRPPATLVAPTIFLDRSVLGLFEGKTVDYSAFTRVPAAVRVHANLVGLSDGAASSGILTFVSTEIFGMDQGIFGSYQSTLQVDETGVIDVWLPPGHYKIQAVPPMLGGVASGSSALGAFSGEWLIPADPAEQFGKLLELPPISEVTGQSRWTGAQVQALPSPQNVLPFEQAFGSGDFAPRAAGGLVDDAGTFVVQADAGKFDISVQAPDSLGFAWFVRPGVVVGPKAQDLGRVSLPTPAVFSGVANVTLAAVDTPLSLAAVRAYAYLDKDLAYTRDPKLAVSVIQVAETRADEQGVFRLLVPSSITTPK